MIDVIKVFNSMDQLFGSHDFCRMISPFERPLKVISSILNMSMVKISKYAHIPRILNYLRTIRNYVCPILSNV